MSEAEKKRRKEYREGRKKRIIIFSAVLCGLILLSTVFGIVYSVIDNTLFVTYTEAGNVSYKVKLFPSPYYDGDWQEPNQSYVADLTDLVRADFAYSIMPDTLDVEYFYTESLTTTLFVVDKQSKVPIYHPEDVIKDPVQSSVKGEVRTTATALIDYDGYRARAAEFIDAYNLTSVDAYIAVTMRVDTVGNRANSAVNTYEMTLKLPLIEKTFRPESTASVSTGEAKQLACDAGRGIVLFRVLTIIFCSLSVLGAAFLICFIYLTRNHDINYAIKVKRLIATYKSFIQEMTTPFAAEGYQVVYIKSFNELLAVRDTVGSPLLMYQNEDGTATTFVIPSGANLLYYFEIRVEDYNEIYGITEDAAVEGEKPSFGAKFKAFFARIWEALKIAWRAICNFFVKIFKRKKTKSVAETEESATETEATEVEATEAEATEAEATETEATEAEATEAEATEAEATEVEATEVEATEAEATETEATEVEATEAEATETEATEAEATEAEATEAEATETEATETVQ